MSDARTPPTPEEARDLLREWATITRDRDPRVHLARDAGLSKMEIHQLSGISRPTIDNILTTAA